MNVEWIITVEKLKNAASVVASECAWTRRKLTKENEPGQESAPNHGWDRKNYATVEVTCVSKTLTARKVRYAVSMDAKKSVSALVGETFYSW